jgi:hypothetical protein
MERFMATSLTRYTAIHLLAIFTIIILPSSGCQNSLHFLGSPSVSCIVYLFCVLLFCQHWLSDPRALSWSVQVFYVTSDHPQITIIWLLALYRYIYLLLLHLDFTE